MKSERIAYQGWQNCYRLTDGVVDLVITADVGPRIIRYGFEDDVNEFKEYGAMLGKMGGDEFRLYGGHRLWHAPEAQPRTYYPDNVPVEVEEHADYLRVIAPAETTTGIQKEIDVYLAGDHGHAQIVHRLRNTNLWTVHLAPWALSVMAPGGKAIIPLPPRGSHEANLQPSSTMTLWAYTDMSDPRWTWAEKYVMLRQDPNVAQPQKAGLMVPDGWAAYVRSGHMFLVKFDHVSGASYPDWGCSIETFTNDEMLEVETLGPMVHLEPNAIVEHVEDWFLFREVPTPTDDDDVERYVRPLLIGAVTQA